MELQKPYQVRPIRFLELWQESGWKIKVYGITAKRLYPKPELVEAAKAVARFHLTQVPEEERYYSVGFLGVHEGRSANFAYVDYWAYDTELYHHFYTSPSDKPTHVTYIMPPELTLCVWDLRVLCFERQAWVDAVLTNPAGVDLEKYLALRLNEDV